MQGASVCRLRPHYDVLAEFANARKKIEENSQKAEFFVRVLKLQKFDHARGGG